MYVVYHMCAWCAGRSEKGTRSLEPELQPVVKLHGRAGNGTLVLGKTSSALSPKTSLQPLTTGSSFSLFFVLSLIYIFKARIKN